MIKAILLFVLLTTSAYADVAPERLQTLSRGINLDTSIFEHPIPMDRDLADIQRVGFHHVRIFVNQEDWQTATNLPRIARLATVVKAAIDQHLGVILCMASDRYPLDDATTTPQAIKNWVAAWQRLATQYRSVSPDQMFFEIANEPGMNGIHWARLQDQLHTVIRQIAPQHTLLLTPSPLAMVWSLPTLPISVDTNVVYIVHLYQPMVFTHQGADWADPAYGPIIGLEYPPNPVNIEALMKRRSVAANPESLKDLAQYERQGATMMEDEIAQAVQWARDNNVHMVVTEFGVQNTAPLPSRIVYLGTTRQGLEQTDIGWTVFQYEGSFGIKSNMQKNCDPIIQALGLVATCQR